MRVVQPTIAGDRNRWQIRFTKRPSEGFTLVELLVVIAIIGAIAAIAIPAVGIVMRTARSAAMRAELGNMQSGIDNYLTKYGDYPPDFSSWNVVKRHYLKIFPDIADSELRLLYRLCDGYADNDANQMTQMPSAAGFDPTALDRAEALVWSLGGFSADKQFPFTGAGGPLVVIDETITGARENPANVEYNPTRNAPEVDFSPDRLSIKPVGPGARTYTNRVLSADADGTNNPNDVFPTYSLKAGSSPIVYFDSRTYAYNHGTAAAPIMNGYSRVTNDSATGYDGVRPVFSTTRGQDPTGANYGSIEAALTGWQFEKPQSYQLLSPGLDGLYGEVVDDVPSNDPTADTPVYFRTDGRMIRPDANAATPDALVWGVQRFDVTGIVSRSLNPFLDNTANFIDGAFGDSLE
ncbi:prepilin-type N-terminal cleavage/methylation domain-containing protein [Rhodopirellula sp. MGV]|uniref:prepilin-type N-terminal cleavage/methylation domain-containing protein n=1 Tax=Rhodopirellula sp. MGV TaxID=2023130 RepID=UPI0018EA1EFB|nr:prepilin-type N-terminal cleavage/methylation domain-containing protein [Rhodopirellula sp. MGV]